MVVASTILQTHYSSHAAPSIGLGDIDPQHEAKPEPAAQEPSPEAEAGKYLAILPRK